MKKFHIGIDFGTYQSKACIYNFQRSDHAFFKFKNDSYFLPSRVVKKNDDTFGYGDFQGDNIVEEYRYFKMESASDEEFQFVTYDGPNRKQNDFYRFNRSSSYTAEFLSVIYLTFIQLHIKEHYRSKNKNKAQSSGGLLGRLFSRTEVTEEEISFTTRIGIPTEWSQENNINRKHKFESILFLSEKLQNKYESINEFKKAHSTELINHIKEIYNQYKVLTEEEFNQELNSLGLSIYPETAAGLAFIINAKLLEPGFYAALDIGAGTTDISFFQIRNDQIKYFASESYVIASNDVYREYSGNVNSIEELHIAQQDVQKLIKEDTIGTELENALNNISKKINKRIYLLFNKRVYFFQKGVMTNNYKNQPIILYGGGSRLPYLNSGNIEIHDNGNRMTLDIERTEIEKIEIDRFANNLNIESVDEYWKPDFYLLVVALGLSYVKHQNNAEWFDESNYQPKDFDRGEMIQHPFNEDCYIYNVLR